jgi:1-aminocyclopropane-1-carboxylate deaminase
MPFPRAHLIIRLGGLDYADFADEIERQEDQIGMFFDTIVTATATGSTQAGMIVGFRAQDREQRLIGIDTTAHVELTRKAFTKIALATAELIGLKRDIPNQDIVIKSQFSGPAYGIPDEATIEAIGLAARLGGMITDPVYEGKSIAG